MRLIRYLRRSLRVKRSIRVVVLTTVVILAVGTLLVFSQGKKGQVQDPVCGLWVDKSTELSYAHKGETYYFCSNRDKDLFKANPAKYLPKK
jgi:YHS domain-containing protein